MQTKKKMCKGCESLQHIWKNHKGKRYCKTCWYKLNVTVNEYKPTKQTPIAPRSSKRAKEEQEYSKVRKTFLLSSPACQAKLPGRCGLLATEIHHKAGRMGNLLTDTNNFLAVCRPCHNWIEGHPIEARELGLSESKTNN